MARFTESNPQASTNNEAFANRGSKIVALAKAEQNTQVMEGHQKIALRSFDVFMTDISTAYVRGEVQREELERATGDYIGTAEDYAHAIGGAQARLRLTQVEAENLGIEGDGPEMNAYKDVRALLTSLRVLHTEQEEQGIQSEMVSREKARRKIINTIVTQKSLFEALAYVEMVDPDAVAPKVFRGRFTPEMTARYATNKLEGSISQNQLALSGEKDALEALYTGEDDMSVTNRRAILFGHDPQELGAKATYRRRIRGSTPSQEPSTPVQADKKLVKEKWVRDSENGIYSYSILSPSEAVRETLLEVVGEANLQELPELIQQIEGFPQVATAEKTS